ncbi:MAG: ribonuclease Z [Bacteroidales bacterium]|nr:ribonuclease Z [Bacteroidales bacterium]
MEFSMITMGTASASANPVRHTSAHVVTVHNHRFLVDCGEGCQMSLQQCKIAFAWIDNILISHLHGDHLLGIFGLLSTMAMQGRTAPLFIYAPEEFQRILNFFYIQFADGVKYDINFVPLKMKEKEQIIEMRQLRVYAFPLNHRVPTFGFLFEEKTPARNIRKELIARDNLTLTEIGALKRGEDVKRGRKKLKVQDYTYIPYEPRSLAYCCDTAPFPQLPVWIKGVDLLYHDSTYADDYEDHARKYCHSTSRMAAQTAKDAGAKQLILGHFSARYRDLEPMLAQAREVFPDTILAEEQHKYEI